MIKEARRIETLVVCAAALDVAGKVAVLSPVVGAGLEAVRVHAELELGERLERLVAACKDTTIKGRRPCG